MASRIQGITVEIGGNTTKLQNALKDVNGQIKSTQSQLKDVNKLLKLDSGNTELLAQKHKLLAEAVSETKEKLATLKTAAGQDTKIWMNSFHIQRKVFETWSGRMNKNRWNPASGNRLMVAMKMTIFIFIWEKVTALIFLFLTMEELWRRLNMAGCFM